MGNGEETILKLERIVKKYKTKASFFGPHGKDVLALNEVSLEILRGEIFGLVGESGSGKTTVGRLIVKLEEPEEGKISLNGNETTLLKGRALRDLRRKVVRYVVHGLADRIGVSTPLLSAVGHLFRHTVEVVIPGLTLLESNPEKKCQQVDSHDRGGGC